MHRLQPSAIVTDEDCAACEFNRPGKTCLRTMDWVWRGETFSATASEYYSLKSQLQVLGVGEVRKGGILCRRKRWLMVHCMPPERGRVSVAGRWRCQNTRTGDLDHSHKFENF